MNGQSSVASLMQSLDAIEHAERRLPEQESTLRQKQQSQAAAIEARRRSSIDESVRLTTSLEKIRQAVITELRNANLDTISPALVSSTNIPQVPANPQLADLSTLLMQVGKRAAALEPILRELEHHRELQAKAARAVQTLKSQPRTQPTTIPIKPTPRLITAPPPSIPQSPPAPPPQRSPIPLALLALAGVVFLALGLLVYYLLTK